MLDERLMIIEVVSTDSRAPSIRKQKQDNRADGTMPEKTLELPEDLDIFALSLSPHEPDVVAISTPKVLGSAKVARGLLFAMGRAGAAVKVAGEDPIDVRSDDAQAAFLARLAATTWGKGTRKQRSVMGRPPKRKQPTEDMKRTICMMWKDPASYTRNHVLDVAEDMLGRTVKDYEVKHWCGDKRGD